MLLSIIIPVYNAEMYLEKCVNSILMQSMSDFELILIDDGSTDQSPEICDRLKEYDKRIIVIHQENAGGGVARNVGIDISRGEYIAFVDSDDYISPIMYELMIRMMGEDIDIIECGYVCVNDNDDFIFDENPDIDLELFDTQSALNENINDRIFRQLIWNKIYRRKVIEGIYFPKHKGIDDEFWTYRALGNAKKLGLLNTCLYAYRQQNLSVMHTLDAKKRLKTFDAKLERHYYIVEHFPKLTDKSLINLWFTALYCGQMICLDSNFSNKNKYLTQISSNLRMNRYAFGALKHIGLKQKIWLLFARVNFKLACIVRARLGIGL